MIDAEFESLLALPHEVPGVEFKGSGARSDKSFFAKVVKAILGMANRRDGGFVVLGVEDAAGLRMTGVDPTVLTSWNHDDVAAAVASYADPSVTISVSTRLRANASFVLIEVAEFERVPVICNKQYDEPRGGTVLKKGALYVRSKGVPATTEVANHAELRDLIDLAIEKGVREFLATAGRAGISIMELRRGGDETLFGNQLSGWDG